MDSNPSTGNQKRKLSKAEIKAYEVRKAAERRRIVAAESGRVPVAPSDSASKRIEHSYTLTRDDEFSVIKLDLKRLAYIVVLLAILLFAATIVLG